MNKLFGILLSFFLFSVIGVSRAAAQETCAPSRYAVNQTVTADHFMVARYGHQKGSPGRLDISSGIRFELAEGPVCEDSINWWRVQSVSGQDAWIPETGAHSLTQGMTTIRLASAASNTTTTTTNTSTTTVQGSCGQVVNTSVDGQRYVEVITGCLNVREGGSILNRIIAKVALGSRLKWEETKDGWYRIISPWGSGWVSGGTAHTKQV